MHTNRRNSVGALAFVAIILCGCSPRVRAADPSIDAYGAANVSHFLVDLPKSVAADDRTHVAEMVKYPISIIVKASAPDSTTNRSF